MTQIKNIIFDLGGVLIDVDYHKTSNAFQALGVQNFDQLYRQSFSNPLFSDLEKGLIDALTFYKTLRETTGILSSDETIETAWNAMLGQFRKESLLFLAVLKKKANIYLLSNTNSIHHKAFTCLYAKAFGNNDFEKCFHKAYYSHIINCRKPDINSYQIILDDNNISAAETLFIDDTKENIVGAEKAGLQTWWLQNGTVIEELEILNALL